MKSCATTSRPKPSATEALTGVPSVNLGTTLPKKRMAMLAMPRTPSPRLTPSSASISMVSPRPLLNWNLGLLRSGRSASRPRPKVAPMAKVISIAKKAGMKPAINACQPNPPLKAACMPPLPLGLMREASDLTRPCMPANTVMAALVLPMNLMLSLAPAF